MNQGPPPRLVSATMQHFSKVTLCRFIQIYLSVLLLSFKQFLFLHDYICIFYIPSMFSNKGDLIPLECEIPKTAKDHKCKFSSTET